MRVEMRDGKANMELNDTKNELSSGLRFRETIPATLFF